jgi:N6-adenosine-specific RNA methylase IME4/ParB-like chromosome segregation protein Spo0J
MTSRAIASIVVGYPHRRDLGDIEELAASIDSIGLLHPIVITPDGKLIAGQRRLAACKALRWKLIDVRVVNIGKIVRGELAENIYRKNFTPSEMVAIAATVEGRERELAKDRMTLGKISPGSERGKVIDKIAAPLGVSGKTLEKARAVVEAAKAEPEKYTRLVEAMDRTGRVNAPYKRLFVAKQAEKIRAEPWPLPGRGPYRVAIVDPPWAYEVDDENAPRRGVLPYATMSLPQICALDVASIMHADSIIFLWVTNFILARGLHVEVLCAWGFEAKTVATWPKDRVGRGHWLKGATEHLVLAVRGKPTITLTNQTTLLHAPVRGHSVKPVEFYDLVESLCPAPRYADLFSRYRHNDRWDCHGDEVPPAEAAQ